MYEKIIFAGSCLITLAALGITGFTLARSVIRG